MTPVTGVRGARVGCGAGMRTVATEPRVRGTGLRDNRIVHTPASGTLGIALSRGRVASGPLRIGLSSGRVASGAQGVGLSRGRAASEPQGLSLSCGRVANGPRGFDPSCGKVAGGTLRIGLGGGWWVFGALAGKSGRAHVGEIQARGCQVRLRRAGG